MQKNSKGELILGFTSKIFDPSALVIETLALREAISLVVNLNLSYVIFESDCMDLVEMCEETWLEERIITK